MKELIRGAAGQAVMTALPARPEQPAWAACLGQWRLHSHVYAPAWHDYLMAVVHLRPIPGVKPAIRKYPEAAYEFSIWALDPQFPADRDDPAWERYHYLQPPNVIAHFHGPTDAAIPALLRALVEDACAGVAPVEPQGIHGGIDWWRRRLESLGATVGHIG
jgi:hypothetical protein